MSEYSHPQVAEAARALAHRFQQLDDKSAMMRAPELKQLYAQIKDLPPEDRARFGREVNNLKKEVQRWVDESKDEQQDSQPPIDVSSPFDINTPPAKRPELLPADSGTTHPITQELERIIDIFVRMGFTVEDSRQLDNEYHHFTALNFPPDHPARDDYDTFMTEEDLIPPAHTSTMQHRILKGNKPPIRAIIPGRVYRNEDVDATHEHTFHQVEGVYVDKDISLGDMLGTIRSFLEAYFEQKIEFKTQPFYFPFVEPGLEFLIKMPEALRKSKSQGDQWLEVMGCGMIHPNVLEEAGIEAGSYSGFAWGFGLDRLVLLRYGIEDIRHFHSGKLSFLEQF